MRMQGGLWTLGMGAVDEERCRGRGSVDGEQQQTAVATCGRRRDLQLEVLVLGLWRLRKGERRGNEE
jgi:hypothetical protein